MHSINPGTALIVIVLDKLFEVQHLVGMYAYRNDICHVPTNLFYFWFGKVKQSEPPHMVFCDHSQKRLCFCTKRTGWLTLHAMKHSISAPTLDVIHVKLADNLHKSQPLQRGFPTLITNWFLTLGTLLPDELKAVHSV